MSTSVPYHIALSKNEAYTHTHIYQSIIALSSPGTKWPCLEYVSVLDTSKCKKSQVHELFPFFSPDVSPLKKRSVLHDEILALVTCSRRIWSWWSMTTIKSSHRNLTLKTAPHGGWPGESHILCVWTWWNYPIKKDTLGRNNDDKSLVFVWCVWCVCPSFWQTHIYGLKKMNMLKHMVDGWIKNQQILMFGLLWRRIFGWDARLGNTQFFRMNLEDFVSWAPANNSDPGLWNWASMIGTAFFTMTPSHD